MQINEEAQAGRFQLVLFLAGLLISLGTAAVTLNVKAEVMESRVLLLEKISEANRQYVSQEEFNRLERRVSIQERKQ